MAPRVSVLMAAYNAEKFISQAIESVLGQEMGDLELIIGDNASTDATEAIARAYATRDQRIIYFRNPTNVGPTANFNLCYRHSDPESAYWALLASDDRWIPSFLTNMVEIARKHSEVTFVHSDMYRTDADGQIINRYSELYPFFTSVGTHWAIHELFAGCYINIMAALVNRRRQQDLLPVENILDPDLTFAPDLNLWLQLLCRRAKAYYVPEPWGYYRKHENAATMPRNLVNRLRDEVVVLRDKIAGVCPPELDAVRRNALRTRLAQLGFELLRAARANEARNPLRAAVNLGPRRLDLTVATAVSGLPIPETYRASLWQTSLTVSRGLSLTRRASN